MNEQKNNSTERGKSCNTSVNESTTASLDEKITYTSHIIDTHFQTFNWLDVKMQALLVIAAASLAAGTFAIKDLPGLSIYESVIIVIACCLLIIGMIISLIHLVPILDSGVGNITNPRVAIVIANMKDKESYTRIMLNLNKEEMLQYNCHQIFGLATICKIGQKHLRKAIIFIGLGLSIIAITISVWGMKTNLDVQEKSNKSEKVTHEEKISKKQTSKILNDLPQK